MRIFMSDMYRVESFYPIDEVYQDILYYLYQPIIGYQAISMYMMLNLEAKRMKTQLYPSSLDRFVSILNMSLADIEAAILKLEGIGLLKSYRKNENGITLYLFSLRYPLCLKTFFNNQILSTLLIESLSEEDYKRTLQYFRLSLCDKKDFEDVTNSFQEVFNINFNNKKKVTLKEELIYKDESSISYKYDTDLLFKSLLTYQISKNRFNDKDIEYITSLALVYSIDPITLAGVIKDSFTSNGLDYELYKKNIKSFYDMNSLTQLNEVYHKQPIIHKSIINDSSVLAQHMKYLDSITPYELLKHKQGGKEPIFHDLKIVETLMVHLGLNPAVVNVLIEYVLAKCDNKLSKGYCESVGATLKRKNIKSAIDAYNVLMDNKIEEINIKEEKNTVENEHQFNDDELEHLLSKIGEL